MVFEFIRGGGMAALPAAQACGKEGSKQRRGGPRLDSAGGGPPLWKGFDQKGFDCDDGA